MQKWFGFVLLLTEVYLTASDHSVQFLSTLNYGQLVTSSTLKWISAENGKIPKNSVIGATRNSQSKFFFFYTSLTKKVHDLVCVINKSTKCIFYL